MFDEQELLRLSTEHDLGQQYAADFRIGFRYGFRRGVDAALQAERERSKILLEALEKCCAQEPDGFGDFIADEFMPESILEGRKLLAKYKERQDG